MAITQISKLQVRRGLQQDLPQLSPGEFGWSTDQLRLFIGNEANVSPTAGTTEILTQYSIINYTNSLGSNVANNTANIAILQQEVMALGGLPTTVSFGTSTSGIVTTTAANNATINYTLTQGTKQRTGTFRLSYVKSTGTVQFDEEYDETAVTDIAFTATANTSMVAFNWTTATATSMQYTITSV
jgi:hypothetical protein